MHKYIIHDQKGFTFWSFSYLIVMIVRNSYLKRLDGEYNGC